MTDTEKAILKTFKTIRRLTVEGNREYWSELYVSGGKFYLRGGNTFPHSTDYNNEISKEEAVRTIKEYLLRQAGKTKMSDEEFLEMLENL